MSLVNYKENCWFFSHVTVIHYCYEFNTLMAWHHTLSFQVKMSLLIFKILGDALQISDISNLQDVEYCSVKPKTVEQKFWQILTKTSLSLTPFMIFCLSSFLCQWSVVLIAHLRALVAVVFVPGGRGQNVELLGVRGRGPLPSRPGTLASTCDKNKIK